MISICLFIRVIRLIRGFQLPFFRFTGHFKSIAHHSQLAVRIGFWMGLVGEKIG